MANKNILLLEPSYKNKYPPLGLMKIAQYHGPNGKNDNVCFVKGEESKLYKKAWDRIYITTLFSFEFKKIEKTIDFAITVVNGDTNKIFVGGIAASLMHEKFLSEEKWHGIRFIKGLLGDAPAISLKLDEFSEELYSEDSSGTPIEDLVPDYNILNQIEYTYPVNDAYFAYASRGCIRKCTFCGVPKLEGGMRDTKPLTEVVNGIAKQFGEKKDMILMDNNVVAAANYKDIISEIIDLGFYKDAKLNRNGTEVQRRVDFNQGVDARILSKNEMYLRELSKTCIKPLRIAFDHLGLKKPYEKSIRISHQQGLNELSNYMLYNFHDTPADLYERLRLNVKLNEELDIRIWSFPMRYQPTDLPERTFVGEKWTKYQLRSMQIILQATHGVVSGAPEFFKRAFGDTFDEFDNLLMRPHHYLFNREWYENEDGKDEFSEYLSLFKKLSDTEKNEILLDLSSTKPSGWSEIYQHCDNQKIKNILKHYLPLCKDKEQEIWSKRKEKTKIELLPEEQRIEDAGIMEKTDF